MLELFIDNKKELQIAETDLLKSSKMLDFSFGIPKDFDIRTLGVYLLNINLQDLKEFCIEVDKL